MAGCRESKCDAANLSQRHAHRDERITAARLDRDAKRGLELGTAAGAVAEASRAAAGERGGRSGGDVDTADPLAGVPCAGWRDTRVRGRPTHRDEREGAARVDRDATRVLEPGAAAGAVAEATRAAAGERGGRPGGDVDTADPLVAIVLRCIIGEHTLRGRARETEVWPHWKPVLCTYAVCEAGVPSAGWRDARVRGRPTHRDEREGAARVDRDADRAVEPGAAAGAVAEATRAAAGERGGRSGGDVDTADPLVAKVLRCIIGEHTLRGRARERRSGRTENRCGGTYAACEAGVVPSAGWRDAGVRGRPTHRDEREGAARVDRDAIRAIEPGTAAGAVAEAIGAAAGERGGRPGGDVDTADPLVAKILRCIMKRHAEEELKRSSGRAACGGNRCYAPTPCARRVLCRLRDGGMRGYGGGRRTATSAKVPLGSIAMSRG
eukprot:scaffold64565_cov62-Phaeocystis_antarctica.AAC.1